MKLNGSFSLGFFKISMALVFTMIFSNSYGFKTNDAGHPKITNEALKVISRTISDEELKFSDRAIEEIQEWNNKQDWNQINSAVHFDNENLAGGSQRINKLKEAAINSAIGENSSGLEARKNIGRALHTIQDYFSHTNHVENSADIPTFGQDVLSSVGSGTETCTGTFLNPGSELIPGVGSTSGYFKIPLCNPPSGKCRHGLIICPGINKDSPSNDFHDEAFTDANLASRDFVESILNDPRIANNIEAIKAIMDIGGTLGFIIDDTGSMGPIIDSVKQSVRRLATEAEGSDDTPEQYLLQTFNDPNVPGTKTFKAFEPFLTALDTVTPHGGGDCPELAWTGAFKAVNQALSVSKLFLFTDAAPKDAGQAGNVISRAKEKKIKIYSALNGSCSPYDPSFYSASHLASGGGLSS